MSASRRSDRRALRGFLAAFLLVLTWFLSMVLEALGAPIWLLSITGAVILTSLIALTAAVHQATCERAGDDPADGRDGRGRPRPEDPGPDGGGGQPSWWPEFERAFADYASDTERALR